MKLRIVVVGVMVFAALSTPNTPAASDPAGPMSAPTPDPAGPLKVLQFNMCGRRCGNNGTAIADATASSIANSGVTYVSLQEVCEHQLDQIVAKLQSWGRAWTGWHASTTNFLNECEYGVAVLINGSGSIESTSVRQLPVPGDAEARVLLCAKVRLIAVVVCSTHFHHLHRPLEWEGVYDDHARRESAESVASYSESLQSSGYRVLIGGDYNDEPWRWTLNALWHPGYLNGEGVHYEALNRRNYPYEPTLDTGEKYDMIFSSPAYIPEGADATYSDISDHHPYYGWFYAIA